MSRYRSTDYSTVVEQSCADPGLTRSLDGSTLAVTDMPTHIVILGWGSLLWDKKPEFDEHLGPWELDGPELKIEFSRVSQSRCGALTLVVDQANGTSCRVACARSKRRDPEDAICDLRSREGTTRANIGFHFVDGSRTNSRDPKITAAINGWAGAKAIDVVVWTDLPPNFEKEYGQAFSVDNALAHICTLDAHAKSGAAQYVWRAPAFVDTPVRRALQAEPWFKQ